MVLYFNLYSLTIDKLISVLLITSYTLGIGEGWKMSKEETVELKLDKAYVDLIRATLKKNPWLGFGEDVEAFIVNASRRHVERLQELEALKRKVGEK